MAAKTSVGIALKMLMIVLFIAMGASLVYILVDPHGYASCYDMQSRWIKMPSVDFSINNYIIWAWFIYKEPNWIVATAVIISTNFLGCLVTCTYIFVQLFKLSPDESSENPLYFLLLKRHKRDRIRLSVVTARVIVSTLGCIMVGVLIYSVIVDPSNDKPVVRCIVTTGTDAYIYHVIFSVWVAYKESSRFSAFLWVILFICFGSIATCVYIVRELFYLSPHQPISLILFNKRDRDLQSSDSLLKAGSDV